MPKKLLNITAALLSTHLLFAQDIKIINADKVAAIESRLARRRHARQENQ